MAVTIIQHANPGSEREKWLITSRARSHATKVFHMKRRRIAEQLQKAVVSPRRTADWCFGGTESNLKELNSREIDLFQSCIRHTPEAILNGHMIRSFAVASAVGQMVFPVLRDLY